MHADAGELEEDADDEADAEEDDFVEDYDPEMSPKPLDPRKMVLEERKLPIISEEDYISNIVSQRYRIQDLRCLAHCPSMPNATPSLRPTLCRETCGRRPKRTRRSLSLGLPPPTWRQSGSTARRLRVRCAISALTRARRSLGIWMRGLTCRCPRRTTGAIGIGPESRGSSTGFIPASSGASTTKRTTSGIPCPLWEQTKLIEGSTDNPPPKVVQGYKFNIFYPDLMSVPSRYLGKEDGADGRVAVTRRKRRPTTSDPSRTTPTPRSWSSLPARHMRISHSASSAGRGSTPTVKASGACSTGGCCSVSSQSRVCGVWEGADVVRLVYFGFGRTFYRK